jgi:hypothetical protein
VMSCQSDKGDGEEGVGDDVEGAEDEEEDVQAASTGIPTSTTRASSVRAKDAPMPRTRLRAYSLWSDTEITSSVRLDATRVLRRAMEHEEVTRAIRLPGVTAQRAAPDPKQYGPYQRLRGSLRNSHPTYMLLPPTDVATPCLAAKPTAIGTNIGGR